MEAVASVETMRLLLLPYSEIRAGRCGSEISATRRKIVPLWRDPSPRRLVSYAGKRNLAYAFKDAGQTQSSISDMAVKSMDACRMILECFVRQKKPPYKDRQDCLTCPED